MANEIWFALDEAASVARERRLLSLFDRNPKRFEEFSVSLGEMTLDFSKVNIDAHALTLLIELAEARGVTARRDAMFAGETINTSENRQVLHPALRDGAPKAPAPLRAQVQATKGQLYELVESIRSGRYTGYTDKAIRDVVHIGIGGSHLGPELAVTALGKPNQKGCVFTTS